VVHAAPRGDQHVSTNERTATRELLRDGAYENMEGDIFCSYGKEYV